MQFETLDTTMRVLETAHEKARYYLSRGVGTTRSMT